jgi:NAD(P)-dependent dehydrogenase (short-subunit alcohol dehydrogenase family)
METKPGNYSDLAGKTAVVTGGSHGVGSGICRELGRQGSRVVVNGRDPAAIAVVTAAVIASGGTAIGIQADVTDQDQVRSLRERAEDAFGPVDILCACAGGQGDPISIGELKLDTWRAGIDVNLTSAFLTLREFVPPMAERRSGAVVTMASTAGRIASPSSPAYAAGKAGLIMLSRCPNQHHRARAGVRGQAGSARDPGPGRADASAQTHRVVGRRRVRGRVPSERCVCLDNGDDARRQRRTGHVVTGTEPISSTSHAVRRVNH